jgi:cation diffusion facilitator CzcD-associated flavoprotein CzcO
VSDGDAASTAQSATGASAPVDVFAVIVGSGFAGLGVAIALERAGIRDFVVLEKSDAIGGTWRDNVYPGCACDVPSHLYSYSFAPNTKWSSMYATQAEIRAYMEGCVDRFGVRDRVRLSHEVTSAVFDESKGLWDVATASGARYRSRILALGMGPLSRFKLPAIPGLDRFKGRVMHSAAWAPGFDGRGQRVASIGTGASAIQFVPEVARVASRLHVFQRTPAWVLPRNEHRYTGFERALFEHLPGFRSLHRKKIYWTHEMRALAFIREPRILLLLERLALSHMKRAIQDPALLQKLRPDYRMGCKRILMSNTYYPALAQPNVELVTCGIREITEHSIVGADGVEREIDALIFGTGFDVHDYLGKVRVVGRSGVELGELWKRGAEAYLGTAVAGFPNLFMIVGPNTGLGHNSIIYIIESQLAHIMQHASLLREGGARTVEVKADVQRAYNAELQRRLVGTVWHTGCKSWYLTEDGRNTTLWPGFTFEFRRRTARLRREDFHVDQ